ncbi:MAG: hypothetical protein VXA26_05975 [Candidatus Neomarinimicrobiota bacterium]|jgi:hypothetical protein
MANFIGILIGIFLTLAGLAGFVGGILLIIAGEWSLLFYLIFVSVIAPFLIAIVMLPSMIFALPAVSLEEKGFKLLSNLLAWLGTLYLGFVFAAWSAYVFIYVMNTTETFWGGVFASFGTAISPIAYMASKEPVTDEFDSVNQTLTMLTAQISLLVMVIMGVLNGGSIYDIGTFYIMTFAVLSIIQFIISNILFREI